MLLLLLSRFSRVRLCATPEMAAHQASPSLGFSRQEHWSGLPFPSPMHESEGESEVAQSCPTPSDPMDCITNWTVITLWTVHHQLLELAQTHVHSVSDAIQPSYRLSPPSPPAFKSFPASRSFLSQLFASVGQSIGT